MIISTRINNYLNIICILLNILPFVIKFCLGKSITLIRQSTSTNYYASGLINIRPG